VAALLSPQVAFLLSPQVADLLLPQVAFLLLPQVAVKLQVAAEPQVAVSCVSRSSDQLWLRR
jgi:hypothetical protein